MVKANNTNIVKKSIPETAFFAVWLTFLQPLHHLPNQEQKVLAAFLLRRHLLSRNVTDKILLNKILFSTDTRDEIRESVGIGKGRFNNIIANLRKLEVFTENGINPKFIPNLDSNGGKEYSLIFSFELK